MGRPLKIAKAQAVLTITGTATTGVVTVSQNLNTLGIIAGMPFVTASTVGGLTANTTYYINQVLNSTTFNVSSTNLSVQPRVYPTLTNTSGQTVSASVAVVDAYFNNPNGGPGFPTTNANTYSVVGGNTAIVGKQVLANIAIGANIAGTIFASNNSPLVVGLGTNFGAVANGTHLYAYQGTPGNYSVNLLGTVSNNVGNRTVAVANSSATGNVIGTSGNAQTLQTGTPVIFDTSFGGLTAGSTYFVNAIPNAAAFTVSTTIGGPNVALTSNSSVTANAIQQQAILSTNSAVNAAGYNGFGDPILGALPEAGYIVRQKGKQKYLVHGTVTGLTAQCYLANLANTALTPNTMHIIATYANSATQAVQSLSDHTAELFTANSGVVATGTANINNSAPVYATFNSQADANVANAMPYPLVQIASA